MVDDSGSADEEQPTEGTVAEAQEENQEPEVTTLKPITATDDDNIPSRDPTTGKEPTEDISAPFTELSANDDGGVDEGQRGSDFGQVESGVGSEAKIDAAPSDDESSHGTVEAIGTENPTEDIMESSKSVNDEEPGAQTVDEDDEDENDDGDIAADDVPLPVESDDTLPAVAKDLDDGDDDEVIKGDEPFVDTSRTAVNETNEGTGADSEDNMAKEAMEKDDLVSQESFIADPYLERDVVNFIGKVLNEDVNEVRAWTEAESSSSTESTITTTTKLNETRGGSQVAPEDLSPEEANQADDQGTLLPVLSVRNDEARSDIAKMSNDAKETKIGLETNGEETVEVVPTLPKVKLDRKSLEASEDKETDASVSIVTWNLAEESPSETDAEFIKAFRKAGIKKGSGSDLVLISAQECENIKPRRNEGRRSREYRRLMIKMLGQDYVPIALHLLGGIQFGLFAKRSFLERIEDVSVADVTCGIGNVFHNKGAICAFLTIKARNPPREGGEESSLSKRIKMIFVTAHMAAHVKNSDARDADFWRISSELEAKAPQGFLPVRSEGFSQDRSFLFDSVDRAFFCGDLNYRVDLPREITEYTIFNRDHATGWPELLKHEQLLRSMSEGKSFPGFAEGKITFAPTFKFDKETGDYDTSHKNRIPAWTDRILFKPGGTRVLSYQSVPDAQHSDHRPVFGTFRVSMEGRKLPPSTKRRRTNKQRVGHEQNESRRTR